MEECVLFTCFGTSDPARDCHDGPMLHIIRNYKPNYVYVFLTKEMFDKNKDKETFELVTQHIKLTIPDYNPKWEFFVADQLTDPSDLLVVDKILREAFDKCTREYSNSDIIINTSSGTPQIKLILSLVALDTKYNNNMMAIQVKNPEGHAGTADRTNHKDYDLKTELELNEDAQNNLNRCLVPDFFPIKREKAKEGIRHLLENRNFEAVLSFKDLIPEDLFHLIKHLERRDKLVDDEAKKEGQMTKTGFSLYPEKKKTDPNNNYYKAFHSTVEYVLSMKNQLKTGRLSDYVLRLEPLIDSLLEQHINNLLMQKYHICINDIAENRSKMNRVISEEKVCNLITEVPAFIKYYIGKEIESKMLFDFLNDLSTKKEESEKILSIANLYFNNQDYKGIKSIRNQLAHNLLAITENDLKKYGGSERIHHLVEEATMEVFSDFCIKERFNIYDKCIKYIIDRL